MGDELLGRWWIWRRLPAGRPRPAGGALQPLAPGAADQPAAAGAHQPVADVGIRAINGLLTVGRGQRMGPSVCSGVGKSVLIGMMACYTAADVPSSG